MRKLSVIEHDKLQIGEGKQLSQVEALALERAQASVGIRALEWLGPNTIKACSYVGVIAAPTIHLEILPKIGGLQASGTRDVLIRMLKKAYELPISDGDIAGHGHQDNDLLEILIKLFAQRLLNEMRRGLARNYANQSDDLARLRGKLNVTRQFTVLATSPNRIACRYDEFTADIPLNRLLLCAANVLRHRSVLAGNQRLICEIISHCEDVKALSVAEALREKVVFDRSTMRWEKMERFARFILQEVYQTTSLGDRDGIALLFDMNVLFEAYVASIARRVLGPLGYTIHTQRPQKYLAKAADGAGVFKTKPDIYIERGGEVILLDTKWKHLNMAARNYGVAQDDAYQMHGYARVYGARSTVLIYPHERPSSVSPGKLRQWQYHSCGFDVEATLEVMTLDLANEESLHSCLKTISAQ